MKKVFISYSHDNLKERKELELYLINLVRNGDIEIWHDELINTGDDWNEKILTALEESDIVIMLVTQSFIASTYIHEEEVSRALGKVAEGTGKIFPILLKTCDWPNWKVLPKTIDPDVINKNSGVMGRYQFFPMDDENQRLKPIADWNAPEKAWTKVVDAIRKMK